MSRKAWIIIIAGSLILLLNNVHLFGFGDSGTVIDFFLTVIIIFMAYKRYNKNNPIIRKTSTPKSVPGPGIGLSPAWTLSLILLVIFFGAGYQLVAAASLNFFTWGDHILGAGNGYPPVLLWGLAGLLFGTMAGSVVIWKKYRLKAQWCLLTVLPFFLMLLLLQAVSSPLASVVPRPLLVASDSAKTDTTIASPVIIPRKKHSVSRIAVLPDTSQRSVSNATNCANQVAGIIINARADSVNVYYRITDHQHGAWGAWRSKFIPQQGQFQLTDEGLVKANSMQYYYEARSVLTRSAQNPFTRLLCEGPLVIDTY